MSINSLATIPRLYHFTDVRNLDSIRKCGGLYPYAELIRMKVKIPAPGGNQWSWDADASKGMGRYVHLCFLSNHPMEYTAKKDGRISETIFLDIDPAVLKLAGVMFSPGVSNKSDVDSVLISKAEIDYDVLYTYMDWRSDPAIYERRKHAEKCEVLVPGFIPLKMIRNMPNG